MARRILLLAGIAALLGFLIRWNSGTSPTGRLVYVCWYDVVGSEERVVLDRMCPPTMEFE